MNTFDKVENSQDAQTCLICLGPVEHDDTAIFTCADHEPYHKNCFQQYLYSKVESFRFGFCPLITCPYTHKKKRFVSKSLVCDVISGKELSHYKKLSSSSLAFKCGGCHCTTNLLVAYDPTAISCLPKSILPCLEKFSMGYEEPSEFYNQIWENCPVTTSNKRDQMIHLILSSIPDENFRSHLQTLHYNKFPRFLTPCCKVEHCFRCKIKNYHFGQSCNEFSSLITTDIVQCPVCCINLSKGDGCDMVQCFCGTSFNWRQQLQVQGISNSFASKFPKDTAINCCRILMDLNKGENLGMLQSAKVWRALNQQEVREVAPQVLQELYPFVNADNFLESTINMDIDIRETLLECFKFKESPSFLEISASYALSSFGALGSSISCDGWSGRRGCNCPFVRGYEFRYGYVRDPFEEWKQRIPPRRNPAVDVTGSQDLVRAPQAHRSMNMQTLNNLYRFFVPYLMNMEKSIKKAVNKSKLGTTTNDNTQLIRGGENVVLSWATRLNTGDILTIKIDLTKQIIDICINNFNVFHAYLCDIWGRAGRVGRENMRDVISLA